MYATSDIVVNSSLKVGIWGKAISPLSERGEGLLSEATGEKLISTSKSPHWLCFHPQKKTIKDTILSNLGGTLYVAIAVRAVRRRAPEALGYTSNNCGCRRGVCVAVRMCKNLSDSKGSLYKGNVSIYYGLCCGSCVDDRASPMGT